MVSFHSLLNPLSPFFYTHSNTSAPPKIITSDTALPLPLIDKFNLLLSLDPLEKEYQERLRELRSEFTPCMAEELKKISVQFQKNPSAQKIFQDLFDRIAFKKKWLALKLNPQWIDDYFQDAAYLIKSRLIYSIIGFQNSTIEGMAQHEIKISPLPASDKTGLWIKKQGNWTPVSQIREEILWKGSENALVSKNCKMEKWSYFSNQGLIPIHPAYDKHLAHHSNYSKEHARMHPVAQLSDEEMNDLLIYAQQFDFHSNSAPESFAVRGVIQFITDPVLTYQSPYLQNLNAQMKGHCGIRLIMPNKDVYSFGFGGNFKEHLLKNKTSQCLASINGQPKILDYMEFQTYAQRLVTTVPLSEIQAKKILDQLNVYRIDGLRFNVLKQNCVRFGTHLLSFAGITLNTRVSLVTTAWRSFPSIEHLPVLGPFLGNVKTTGLQLWKTVAAKIPSIVKQLFIGLASLILYIPNQLLTLLLNLGMVFLGGKNASPNSSLELEKSSSGEKMENFETLITHLFDNESLYVHHSSIFIHWQLNQATTEVFRYSGQPQMNLLPPMAQKDKSFSIQHKKKLQTIYQYSTPV